VQILKLKCLLSPPINVEDVMKAVTHLTLSPGPPVLVLSRALTRFSVLHTLVSIFTLGVCMCVLLNARGGIICESVISEK